MPTTNKCRNCECEFNVKPSEAKWRIYCSKKCKKDHLSVVLQCAHCGTDYRKLKSQIPETGTKYCSKACKDLARTTVGKKPKKAYEPVFKVCKTCSKTYRVPPSRKETATYCSVECKCLDPDYRKKSSDKQAGDKSWRWSGGRYQSNRGYIRLTDRGRKVTLFEHRFVMLNWMLEEAPNHPFLISEKTGLHPDIEIHHIDRDRANNTRSNLLAVTKQAHAMIHAFGKKPEQWECWPPNPANW